MAKVEVKIPASFYRSVNKLTEDIQRFSKMTEQANMVIRKINTQQVNVPQGFISSQFKRFGTLMRNLESSFAANISRITNILGSFGKAFIRSFAIFESVITAITGPIGWALEGVSIVFNYAATAAAFAASIGRWFWNKMVDFGDAMLKDYLEATGTLSSIGGLRAYRAAFAGIPGNPAALEDIARARTNRVTQQYLVLQMLGVKQKQDSADMLVDLTLAVARFMKAQPRGSELQMAEAFLLQSYFPHDVLVGLLNADMAELEERARKYYAIKEKAKMSDMAVGKWKEFRIQIEKMWAHIQSIIGEKLASPDSPVAQSLKELSKGITHFIDTFMALPLVDKAMKHVEHWIDSLSGWLESGKAEQAFKKAIVWIKEIIKQAYFAARQLLRLGQVLTGQFISPAYGAEGRIFSGGPTFRPGIGPGPRARELVSGPTFRPGIRPSPRQPELAPREGRFISNVPRGKPTTEEPRGPMPKGGIRRTPERVHALPEQAPGVPQPTGPFRSNVPRGAPTAEQPLGQLPRGGLRRHTGPDKPRIHDYPPTPQGTGTIGWWTPDRVNHAVNRLMAEGHLSEAGAKALVARWTFEAPGGPAEHNPRGGGRGAHGVAQWRGPRLNSDVWSNDFDKQITHAIDELNTTHKRIGDQLRNATTPEEGARAASRYEGAEHPFIDQTMRNYNKLFPGGKATAPPQQPVPQPPQQPVPTPQTRPEHIDSPPTQTPQGPYTPIPSQRGALPLEQQRGRPYQYDGTIDIDGSSYKYRSGGGRTPSAPYGTFELTPDVPGGDVWRYLRGKEGAINLEKGTIWDPLYNRNRSGIYIHHNLSNKELEATAGCLGINKRDWPKFLAQVRAKIAKEGPQVITIEPGGHATIHSINDAPSRSDTKTPTISQQKPDPNAPPGSPGSPWQKKTTPDVEYPDWGKKSQVEAPVEKKGAMLFLHGMQSRYDKMRDPRTPAQIEDAARRLAAARGENFEKIDISGDNPDAQLKAARERIKQGGITDITGFSAGGNTALKLQKEFPDLSYTAVQAGRHGEINTPNVKLPPGTSHMKAMETLADQEEQKSKTPSSRSTAPTVTGPGDWSDLPAFPNKYPRLQSVDPRLREVISAGRERFEADHPGYKVTATSGRRDPGKGAGPHWSEHGAIDTMIVDPSGHPISNEGNDPTGLYHELARHVYGETLARYPELAPGLRWGGAFGTKKGGGGPPDLMHYDLQGLIGWPKGRRTWDQIQNLGPMPGVDYSKPIGGGPSDVDKSDAVKDKKDPGYDVKVGPVKSGDEPDNPEDTHEPDSKPGEEHPGFKKEPLRQWPDSKKSENTKEDGSDAKDNHIKVTNHGSPHQDKELEHDNGGSLDKGVKVDNHSDFDVKATHETEFA